MRHSDQAMSRKLDGEVVILDVSSGEYYSLNGVGALIWDQLATDVTIADLVAAVTAEFDVEASVAEADIAALLRDLAEAGLVVE